MTTLSAKYKNKILYTSIRTHFLLFDVGIARVTFQIRPHQYFQCFDFTFDPFYCLVDFQRGQKIKKKRNFIKYIYDFNSELEKTTTTIETYPLHRSCIKAVSFSLEIHVVNTYCIVAKYRHAIKDC